MDNNYIPFKKLKAIAFKIELLLLVYTGTFFKSYLTEQLYYVIIIMLNKRD